MRATITDVQVLSAVTPLAIHAYLDAQGWRKTQPFGNKGDVYVFENEPEIVAPASSHFADYSRDVSQILSILARAEDRDEVSVLRDLSVADLDLIRIRAPEAEDDGSIPIDSGVELIQQSRDLLLAAACAASRPQRAFRAGRNREANDYLREVRIGQTERGSFVITLLSPVPPSLTADPQPSLWPNLPSEPFPRKVTRRLIGGLSAARDAVSFANRGEGIGAFEQRIDKGVSANLCEAAARLIEDGDGLDVSVTWALTRLAPERRARVEFRRADADILQEAARVLRDREARPGERVDGYVTSLARGENTKEGRITIKAQIDGIMSSIKVYFEPEEYSVIADAHDRRQVVSLEGDLKREGQRWSLVNPRDLQILGDDDDDNDDDSESGSDSGGHPGDGTQSEPEM